MKAIKRYLSNKIKASDIKATDDNIKQIVKAELDRLGHDADLNHINVSKVTSMYNVFRTDEFGFLGIRYIDLNPDVSKWNVENCKIFDNMFRYCENFNCDISKWDTKNATSMRAMFFGCIKFKQDLSGWDVSYNADYTLCFFKCPLIDKKKYWPHNWPWE